MILFITWKRLILYQEFNQASFQSLFWRKIKREEFSLFWLKSCVNPFAKNPKWRFFQKDIFITWKRLILYQEFKRASFQSPFWRKTKREEFSIFWLKSCVNSFAKTESKTATFSKRYLYYLKKAYFISRI